MRLRWLSHHSSRLRIFFGSIPLTTSTVNEITSTMFTKLSHYLGLKSVHSTHFNQVNMAKKLLILGIEGDPFSKHVIDRIYSLLPTSARIYKLGDHYKPLFPTSVLTSIEIPAYKPSNDNRRNTIEIQVHDHIKQQVLEGVRKEIDKQFNSPPFVFKCIGDDRLTIVHIDNPKNKPKTALEFFHYSGPLQNVGGIILATEYDIPSHHQSLYERIYRLVEIAKGHYKCNESEQYFQQSNHFSNPSTTTTTMNSTCHPFLLLFLYIPNDYLITISETSHPMMNTHQIKSIVSETNDIMARCVNTIDPSTAWKYQWFVQPVPHITPSPFNINYSERKKKSEPLQGFLAGLNWLIRTMSEHEYGEI
mmetsp:Transcript_194/g.265  ORF Transcript_194/g.265 Transcript_194/m.265 type:complete len:362 (+) Transcript_194:3-1088(+)